MNSNEIIRMVVKLTGLAIFITGIIQASSSLPMVFEQITVYEEIKNTKNLGSPFISLIGGLATPIIIGIFLWLFPAPVANTIIKDDINDFSNSNFLQGIEKIGIRLLGLYLLYYGISDLVNNIISYKQEIALMSENFKIYGKGSYKVAFIVTAIEVVISIFLIFGSNTISNFINKFKYAS